MKLSTMPLETARSVERTLWTSSAPMSWRPWLGASHAWIWLPKTWPTTTHTWAGACTASGISTLKEASSGVVPSGVLAPTVAGQDGERE